MPRHSTALLAFAMAFWAVTPEPSCLPPTPDGRVADRSALRFERVGDFPGGRLFEAVPDGPGIRPSRPVGPGGVRDALPSLLFPPGDGPVADRPACCRESR